MGFYINFIIKDDDNKAIIYYEQALKQNKAAADHQLISNKTILNLATIKLGLKDIDYVYSLIKNSEANFEQLTEIKLLINGVIARF